MSSLTSPVLDVSDAAARRAVLRARLAPLLSLLAAAAGLVFVVIFLVQAGLFASLLPRETYVPPTVENPEQITSYDSTLAGVDKDGQPYAVKAERAWQEKEHTERVHLETMTATFRKATGETYSVTARTALYNSQIKDIDLAGSVVIVQPGRFTARMEKAHVTVTDKKLTSDVPVEVTTGTGIIHANGIEIADDGADILFLNGVKAHFDAAPAEGEKNP